MVECQNMQDFLMINFPLLSQRTALFSGQARGQKSEENQIDISIYFEENDKYLINMHDKALMLSKEFKALPMEEMKIEMINKRIAVFDKYDRILNDLLKESAAKEL